MSGGYPADIFLRLELKDKLTCPICLDISKDVVCCVEKDHFFCRQCITTHLVSQVTKFSLYCS